MATVGTSITSARILVVEDEPIIALDLERTFVDAGAYVVGPAYTLFEALEFARKEAIDVAILDVRLGGENSRDVARILASRGVPILIYSGQVDDMLNVDAGEAIRLSKPASPETILAALETLLSHSSQQ